MKISARHRFVFAVGLLCAGSLVFGVVTIGLLYRHSMERERDQLVTSTQKTTKIIEAFYALRSEVQKKRMAEEIFDHAGHLFPPFGKTGTYLLLTNRAGKLKFWTSRPTERDQLNLTSVADLGEPAKRALSGESGTLRGIDYRGVEVLASYDFIKDAGTAFVVKIDMAELRKPFLIAGLISLLPAGAALLFSLLVLVRHYFPVLRRLSESENSIRALISSAADAIITIDETRKIHTFNLAAERMFLYPAAEVLGKNVKLLMTAQFARDHDEKVLTYLKTGQRKIIGIGREVVCLRKDGTEFPAHLSISEAIIDGKHFFTGILKDLSEVRELSRQIIRIQENERDRIAREIHDDLGTSLALLKFKIQSAFLPDKGAGEVNEVVNYLNDILTKTRLLARDLSPVGFKNLGFPEAVEVLAARIPRSLQVHLDLEEMRNFFPENWDPDIYRIFQESIANVIKHAQASRLDLIARCTGNRLNITVRDNGKGATPAQLYSSGGLGLALMMQRARTAGGTARVTSEINQGLEVKLEIYKRNKEQ